MTFPFKVEGMFKPYYDPDGYPIDESSWSYQRKEGLAIQSSPDLNYFLVLVGNKFERWKISDCILMKE